MSKSSPVAITTNLRTNFAIVNAPGSWSAISAGSNNSLAVNSTGTLFAWGAGVGTGDVVLTNYSKVSEGVGFALALTPNGALYATGINSSGQLGDGTTINKIKNSQEQFHHKQIKEHLYNLYYNQYTKYSVIQLVKINKIYNSF